MPHITNKIIDGVTVFRPTRRDIQAVRVGGLAPDYYGRMMEVTEVFGTGINVAGQAFVCYYVRHGLNGTVSNSMTEGEVLNTIPVTIAFHRSSVAETRYAAQGN